jgi:transcriptional regulator of arginine metabolism
VPGAADLRRLDELTGALRRWAGGFAPSGTLCVIATPRGFAAALADAIDAAGLEDVAGTIAGDNTVFVAARDGVTGANIADELRRHLD